MHLTIHINSDCDYNKWYHPLHMMWWILSWHLREMFHAHISSSANATGCKTMPQTWKVGGHVSFQNSHWASFFWNLKTSKTAGNSKNCSLSSLFSLFYSDKVLRDKKYHSLSQFYAMKDVKRMAIIIGYASLVIYDWIQMSAYL